MSQDPNQPPIGGPVPDDSGTGQYEAEGYEPSGYATNNDGMEPPSGTLGQNAPAVAAPQNRIVLVLLGVVVIVVFILYMLFSGDKEPSKEELAAQQQTMQVAPQVETPEPLPEPPTPQVPTTPDASQTALPPLPLPPQEVTDTINSGTAVPTEDPAITEARRKEEEDRRQKRLRSNMVIGGGGAASGIASAVTGNTGRVSSADAATGRDSNSQFERSVNAEKVDVVSAQRMTDGRITIAQGKMVNVVLESAVNTDLPTPIRAIVSRDVYAEAGKQVLIPKGSRVIGRYNTDVFRGQKRIFVIWTRVMRPDGISVAIGSPGVDQIGRAGIEGVVDNKYLEVYSSAILTSLLTIGIAVGADSAVDGDVSTSNNALGGSTTTGTAGAQAVQQSITDLGDTTRNVVGGLVNVKPTITLDQGTRMNIFVNRDLTFPENLTGGGATVLQ